MDCPVCKCFMVLGSANASAAGRGFAVLEFKSDETGNTSSILRQGFQRQALCCPDCGSIFVVGKGVNKYDGGEAGEAIVDGDFEGIECFQCKSRMPADLRECPSCGWTYA